MTRSAGLLHVVGDDLVDASPTALDLTIDPRKSRRSVRPAVLPRER
jgi:hypothetical protein